MKKNTNYIAILEKLKELHSSHPSYSFGRHISIAFSEYGDVWGITDKEALFALEKYAQELEGDNDRIVDDHYIDQIIKDAQNLDTILDEEEEDGDI